MALSTALQETNTTKANVATVMQTVAWGLEGNGDSEAASDEKENFFEAQIACWIYCQCFYEHTIAL